MYRLLKYKVIGLIMNCVIINKINKSICFSTNSIHHLNLTFLVLCNSGDIESIYTKCLYSIAKSWLHFESLTKITNMIWMTITKRKCAVSIAHCSLYNFFKD